MAALLLLFCVGLQPPVQGPLVGRFAPEGRYGGHWGVDWAVPVGTAVRAAAPGTVTFVGVVAGNRTVTIHHGGGLRTSYSYLDETAVQGGQWVPARAMVGRSGVAHGVPSVHFSLRLGHRYLAPLPALGCRTYPPAPALRLVSVG